MRRPAAALLATALVASASAAASGAGEPWDGVRWGEGSAELARALGPGTRHLAPPLDFGPYYVDTVVPGEPLGGYAFTIYFQMDRASHGLRRVMLERQRHGANPRVFRAVIGALTDAYGPPTLACDGPARPPNGYQAASERQWRRDQQVIRAVFRDTSIEASEGCLEAATVACGLTGRLAVWIEPAAEAGHGCRLG